MKKLIESFLKYKGHYHASVVFCFGIFSILFYYPTLSGKALVQSDIRQYTGMSRQIQEHRKNQDEEIYWIDNAFGGMPTYQLGARYPADFLTPIHKIFQNIPQPAEILFLYLLSTYLFLLIIRMPWHIAVFGALAYGLSTYLLIILQVGHNTKAQALAYMPLVLGGVYMIFNDKKFGGFLLTVLALAMQIRANHYQMTYYMLLLLLLFVIVYFFKSIKEKSLKPFAAKTGILVFSGLLALGLNATSLLATAEYSNFSTRGKSELTQNPDNSLKEVTSGLDTAYITQFSYGIFESLNLLIPRIQGGGSREDLGKDSELYKFMIQQGVPRNQAGQFVQNVPTYWGDQPILEAPAYVGITIVFLAIISLFLIKGALRNWLFAGIIMSLLLSWGKNLPWLTQFFIDYFPLYNKFRAVSSIQVILEFCFPVLACLGLHLILEQRALNPKKSILKTATFFLSFLLLLLLSKSIFDFSGGMDGYLSEAYGPMIMDQILEARRSIFSYDIIRAILYMLATTAILYLFIQGKLSKKVSILALFALLASDLLGISNRYIDRDLFVLPRQKSQPFLIQASDRAILKDSARYRVFEPNLALSGARTAYFHNAIGGYHGAKPRRFEELFEYFSANQIEGVLDMLNVKYILFEKEKGQKFIQNPNAMGNAWFVDSLFVAVDADGVLNKMKSLNFQNGAIVLASEAPENIKLTFSADSLSRIDLTKAHPTRLEYKFSSSEEQMVVFSEMYYAHGWKSSIDGIEVDHFPVNYVLRGLNVPKGNHDIVFSFEPSVIKIGTSIRLLALVLFFGVIPVGLYKKYKR